MLSNNKSLRILLPVIFVLTILLSNCFIPQAKAAAEAADNPMLSAGGLRTPPILAADSSQNVIRKPVELTFVDDAAWREAISEVIVEGVPLESTDYNKDIPGKIIIDKGVFQTSRDYEIVIRTDGYKDANVKQPIGLFYITGDGVTGEVVFTHAQLEAMNQERVIFSATNDFPYDLIMAVEGVPLRNLLEKAGIKPGAQVISFRGSDGFTGEFTIDELLNQKRYCFPDNTKVEPVIALKRAERSADFNQMYEKDTPILCFGQRARTEQTLLQSVKIIQSISVSTDSPQQWPMPTAKIIDPESGQKAAAKGGVVKNGTNVILEGDPKTKIYYTIDGTEPNLNSKIFNESGCGPLAGQHQPILVQNDTTIKAKAVWGGKMDSEVAIFRFTIDKGHQSGITVGVSDNTTAVPSGTTFTDIQGNWAQADIELLVSRGLIAGKSANAYEPGSNITRAEFAALLVRALSLEEGGLKEGQFKDVPGAAWYAGSIAAATAADIITGYKDNLFKPDENITREEMAVMIIRAVHVAGKEIAISDGGQEQEMALFHDRTEISSWAADDAAMAVKFGIIKGMPGGQFSPQNKVDRAQTAVILNRLLTYVGSQR